MDAKRNCKGVSHQDCCFDADNNPYCCMARRSFGSCSDPCEGPCYIITCMLLKGHLLQSQERPGKTPLIQDSTGPAPE
jgi:hypothetical protein